MAPEGTNWKENALHLLSQEDGRRLYRGTARHPDGREIPLLVIVSLEQSAREHGVDRLANEFSLRTRLQNSWAVEPLFFAREARVLYLRDPGGTRLSMLVGDRLSIGAFLRIAISLSDAVENMHSDEILHRDVKPSNFFIEAKGGTARLTGFGFASQFGREVLSAPKIEFIPGTFAYMAPEQTGRMNCAIDVRSDLYSLGVTLYELLTGVLPFRASDALEWIHSHMARQPMHPSERRIDVPSQVSEVIMKLLGKAPEARYQTASGLRADLVTCLEEWSEHFDVPSFPLGQHDISAQLRLGERLCGREAEAALLSAAYSRMVTTGERQLVLVAGQSGVGKSSLVNELQREFGAAGALFASGKFDQYKRDIPYAAIAQALRMLLRDLLSKPDEELEKWREAIVGALGGNGQVVAHLIPEIELLIGKQSPLNELSGSDAQRRFMQVLRQFVGVFATREHPLVLLLDDLQWLDSATLDVFETLATHPEIHHLMLIGVFRNNDAGGAANLLYPRIASVRRAGIALTEICLEDLGLHDVHEMLADLLHCSEEEVAPLAQSVFGKAGGNPFYLVQFIRSLVDAGIVAYDMATSRWGWVVEGVAELSACDNIVDLMIERLSRLRDDSLSIVQALACMGHRADRSRLAMVLGRSCETVHEQLQEAQRSGLVIALKDDYGFAHDRIHEAAYGMLSSGERLDRHLFIARTLLATVETESEVGLDVHVFEVVSHFNRAQDALTDPNELADVARLNLLAGRKARASAAYCAACDYLVVGRKQIGENGWIRAYELTFSLTLEHAECAFLDGEFATSKALVDYLLANARDSMDLAATYRLKVELHVVNTEYEDAVHSGLLALKQLGIDLPLHPSDEDVKAEYDQVWVNLDGRPYEALADLPQMSSATHRAAMRILAELWPPTYYSEFRLAALVICKMANLSLLHGSTYSSNQGFALLGWLMGPVFGRFQDGHHLTRTACELAARRDSPLDYGRTCVTMALTSSWTEPLNVAIDWFRSAWRKAIEAGDLYFGCYCGQLGSSLFLLRGRNLSENIKEVYDYLDFARRIAFDDGVAVITTVERTIACLRAETYGLTDFGAATFDAAEFEGNIDNSRSSVLVQWYWTRKTMLYFMAGEFDAALSASQRVYTGPWTRVVQIEHLDYHFFTALAICASVRNVVTHSTSGLKVKLSEHVEAIRKWATETGSPVFSSRHLIVQAECASLDGKVVEAEHLYEQAARLAQKNGFLHTEGLANELASRFYLDRGFERIAQTYLMDAVDCYDRWGATAKVKQLRRMRPTLRGLLSDLGPRGTSPIALDQIDLASVVKSSRAVSSEVVIDELITTLMRTVVEHAGAERAVLMTARDGALHKAAEALTKGESMTVHLGRPTLGATAVAESIVRYVVRTQESTVVEDASNDSRFADDPHVIRNRVRSLLCIPIIAHGKLQALLYLENNLSPHCFTQSHVEVLELLASQAAISLENAGLYAVLEAREYRIRRIFDVDVIGLVFWDLNGQLLEANEAFLRMLGYSRAELERGALRWFDMTPPEWREQISIEVDELKLTGALRPIEKEFFRKDGSRIPVLIGAATLERTAQQGVAIIVDLSKQKDAESRALEVERRNRKLHTELAHASRIVTVGHLSAWIAHDVKQPLAGIVTSGTAGLRWLSAEPPNIPAATRTFERVIQEGMRTAQILDRIRLLIKKTPPKAEDVDVNVVIADTLTLIAPEAERNGIRVQSRLCHQLPASLADRVQLQQVVLNLLINAMEAMVSEPEHQPRELLVTTDLDPLEGVLVEVCDTGPGFGPSTSEELFEAFHSTKADGLGIGLAICRSVIESFGGRIWASVRAPRGAVFRFALPLTGERKEPSL